MQQLSIRGGNEIWREFVHAVELEHTEAIAYFDRHNVIDAMTHDQAVTVGVELDHMDHITPLILSKSRSTSSRRSIFDDSEWKPMAVECEGTIFTEMSRSTFNFVDVYREPWMSSSTVGVFGDKGQVAALARKPCVLFDDKEMNLDLVINQSSDGALKEGVLVRIGKKRHRRIGRSKHGAWPYITYDPYEWPDIVYNMDFTQARHQFFFNRLQPH